MRWEQVRDLDATTNHKMTSFTIKIKTGPITVVFFFFFNSTARELLVPFTQHSEIPSKATTTVTHIQKIWLLN